MTAVALDAYAKMVQAEELKACFECQRKLGNPQVSVELKTEMVGNGDKKKRAVLAAETGISWKRFIENVYNY